VTLCAVCSTNVAAAVSALEASLAQVDVGSCKLFTDKRVHPTHPRITVVPIAPITSAQAYSHFVLTRLVDHVDTAHCLIVQWDGHVLDASRWRPDFLDYDYIGAAWPQFDDGHDVGNGGFSLRSRRLMLMCREAGFDACHPEDIAIGRGNRGWLEARGIRFAPRALADVFSAERAGDPLTSFGFHGVWHMPRVLGVQRFWQIYRGMDDRSTIWHDFAGILGTVGQGALGPARILRLLVDRAVCAFAHLGARQTGTDNGKPTAEKDLPL